MTISSASRAHPEAKAGMGVSVPGCVSLDLVEHVDAGVLGAGPWDATVWVSVPGRVRSKSNYRKRKDSTWREVSGYEDEVHALLRAARPACWPRVDADQPTGERPLVVAVLAARTGLDAGNLSKSVLDAAEGCLYVSDAQVRCLTDLVVPARDRQGLLAVFAALPASTDLHGVLDAQAQLTTQVTTLLSATP